MKKAFIIIGILLSVGYVSAQEGIVRYAAEGFEILPLEEEDENLAYQILFMTLPATEGFSANVNVLKQQYFGSLRDYHDLSLSQFEQFGFEVVSTNLQNEFCIFQYRGFNGRELRFYAKALLKDGFVYLATATATPRQWLEHQDQLKRVVNSFRF